MNSIIRQAEKNDAAVVSDILREAAQWLIERGEPLWRNNELTAENLQKDVDQKLFFLAEIDGEAVGTVKFQTEDKLFWRDVPEGESAFIHRLAVRRRFAGGAISRALMSWAVERACGLGKSYLRLDCEASRPKLRAVYEKFGFTHHSDKKVGPYFVARYELKMEKKSS